MSLTFHVSYLVFHLMVEILKPSDMHLSANYFIGTSCYPVGFSLSNILPDALIFFFFFLLLILSSLLNLEKG